MSNGKSSKARPPRKRAKTTAKSSAIPKIPQPHGGALNAGGTPGNAGGGRPKKAFKQFLAELREDPDAQTALANAAKDMGSRGAFSAAWGVITDYDEERPGKKHEHRFPDLTPEQRTNRVAEILNVAKQRLQASNGNGNGNGAH